MARPQEADQVADEDDDEEDEIEMFLRAGMNGRRQPAPQRHNTILTDK